MQSAPRPISDSPWFWAYLFSTSALIALTLGLAAAWSASGRKELLYALGAAFVLLLTGLIIERLVITDREAINATLLQIARDVQSNNHRSVVQHIASTASSLKQKAESE